MATSRARARHGGGSAAVAAVVGLTLLGAVLRLVLARQSLFADELSTWWIVSEHGLRGVVSTVHSDAEISPPAYFVLSWLALRLGDAPELVRAPSIIAGIALVPLVHALGVRTVARPAALVAAALTALGPFAIYYAADARGYAMMMAAVVLSTLALLQAVDTHRRSWWVVYAGAVALGMYSHYTCAFPFAAQFAWVLWAHPPARRAAIAATAGAVVLFVPWLTGLAADLDSPTTRILAALSPFDWASVRFTFGHWIIGYPAAIAFPLRDYPGRIAVGMFVLGVLLAASAAVVRTVRRRGRLRVADADPPLVLVVLVALSAPVAEALLNVVGTQLFSVRNLASSWPAAILVLAFLLVAAGPRLRVAATALTLAAFAVAAIALLQRDQRNPDYLGAARYVDRGAGPRDVVIDATGVLSPGPLTPLDAALQRPHRLVRAVAPAQRDHPYTIADPIVPIQDAIRDAVGQAGENRIWVVSTRFPEAAVRAQGESIRRAAMRNATFPPSHRLVEERSYGGVLGTVVRVYERG